MDQRREGGGEKTEIEELNDDLTDENKQISEDKSKKKRNVMR